MFTWTILRCVKLKNALFCWNLTNLFPAHTNCLEARAFLEKSILVAFYQSKFKASTCFEYKLFIVKLRIQRKCISRFSIYGHTYFKKISNTYMAGHLNINSTPLCYWSIYIYIYATFTKEFKNSKRIAQLTILLGNSRKNFNNDRF